MHVCFYKTNRLIGMPKPLKQVRHPRPVCIKARKLSVTLVFGNIWKDFQFHHLLKNIYTVIYVTLDHKTSLKCQFFEIEIYTSSKAE